MFCRNLDGLGNILNKSQGLNTSLVEGDVLITQVETEEMTVRIQYLNKLYRYSVPKVRNSKFSMEKST